MENTTEPGKKVVLLLFGKPIPPHTNATFLYHDKTSLSTDDGKNPVLLMSDFFEFPCADSSISELRIESGLEQLEKKYLYMVLSEARRCVQLGGKLILKAPELRRNLKPLEASFTRIFQKQFLQLHHFFSPEDWDLVQEKEEKSIFFLQRTLELKRTDHILSETPDLKETISEDQDHA